MCFCVHKNRPAGPVRPLAGMPVGIRGMVETPIQTFTEMKTKRTRQVHFRISEEEYDKIKKRAAKYGGITQFYAAAAEVLIDTSIQERIELRKLISEQYLRIDQKLAHSGGNLNQAMRQVNEAAKVAHPTQALILNSLMPQIEQYHQENTEVRKLLSELTKKCMK